MISKLFTLRGDQNTENDQVSPGGISRYLGSWRQDRMTGQPRELSGDFLLFPQVGDQCNMTTELTTSKNVEKCVLKAAPWQRGVCGWQVPRAR